MSEPTDEGAALTPDEVTGPEEGRPAPVRRDRKPLYAMLAGLAAVWFALFGPILVIVLAPTAILLARRVRSDLTGAPEEEKARRQATIGFWTGIAAAVLLVAQIIYVQLFFEWEKRTPEPEDKPAVTTEVPADTTAPPTTAG